MWVLAHLAQLEKPVNHLSALTVLDEGTDGLIDIGTLPLGYFSQTAVSLDFGPIIVHLRTIPEILRDCKEPYPILP